LHNHRYAARVADYLSEKAGINARLDARGKIGELTVWVGSRQVVRKGFFKSPDIEDVLEAVQQALAEDNAGPL
jgi:hypothetical protein